MKCLADFRAAQGLTRAQMADALDMTISLYDKIEYNQREPSRGFLKKFKKAFPSFDINIFFVEMLHNKGKRLKATESKNGTNKQTQ